MQENYDNMDTPDPDDEAEGIARARDLEEKLLRIAEIAAECEIEDLGPKSIQQYYDLLSQCALGKYEPKTALSFFPYIQISIETVFGDLPDPYYEMYVAQISQEVINFYTDMYIYFLKAAFLHAIEILLLEEQNSKKN